MVEGGSGRFTVTIGEEGALTIDFAVLESRLLSLVPEGVKSGKVTDPMRGATKLITGFLCREIAMQIGDGSYPKPPTKRTVDGSDLVMAQLRYLLIFLCDLIAEDGGLVVEVEMRDGVTLVRDVRTDADGR